MITRGPTKPRPLPAAERLHELLTYDPATGELRWRVRRANQPAGSSAGHLNKEGYLHVGIDYALYLGHRVAWKMHYGTEPPELDHADGDGRNNRVANLRAASRMENNGNAVVRRASSTGVKGVFKRGHGYIARVGVRHVGSFKTLDAARAAYLAAATDKFGEFAYDGAPR